jgi:hypothetical protein
MLVKRFSMVGDPLCDAARDVEAVGGGSLFELDAGKAVTVAPLSEQAFYVDRRYHTQIVFTKDASGRVSGVVLNPGPWGQKGKRVD